MDVRLIPSTGGEIDEATLQSFAASGMTLFRKEEIGGDVPINALAAGTNQKPWISLGDGKVRLFFNSAGVEAGVYVLTVATTAAWQDSAAAASNTNKSFSFELVDPKAEVASPFSSNNPSVDVHVANAQSPNRYIDVVYKATPGAALDYESILDSGQESTSSERAR